MIEIRFEVLPEVHQDVQALILSKGWSPEGGLRNIFLAGLSRLRIEEAFGPDAGQEAGTRHERLSAEYVRISSAYAALRHKHFLALRDNQALELNLAGFERENDQLLALVKELKRNLRELESGN